MSTTQRNDLLTVNQVAEELGFSNMAVYRWIEAGELRAYKIGVRAIRIDRADLNDFMRPIGGDEQLAG